MSHEIIVNIRILPKHMRRHLSGPLQRGRLSNKTADLFKFGMNSNNHNNDNNCKVVGIVKILSGVLRVGAIYRNLVRIAAVTSGVFPICVRRRWPPAITVASQAITLQFVGKNLATDGVDLPFRKIEWPRQVQLLLIRST